MKYFKRRKYRGGIVKMKFQSFVDLSTEADNMKIISVNVGGVDTIKRLAPFFLAYKYYRLGGVSIKMIPAATLPVSPSGLSYEVDEPGVDPRDQLTPGMMRITNGEDVFEDLTGLTGDQQRALYNNMLLDIRWYKFMLQSGVKRYASPRYWQIGQLHQDKWPGAIVNIPHLNTGSTPVDTYSEQSVHVDGSGIVHHTATGSDPRGFFQTGHRGRLGWMPTDSLVKTSNAAGTGSVDNPEYASVPEVEVMKILLPPVIKTNYFYRMFITETVYFKSPIVMNTNGYRPIDVFHGTSPLTAICRPLYPSTEQAGAGIPSEWFTGGNYGDD